MGDLTIIERFREGHHAVARMIAAGMTPSMVRQRTGYSTRRLTLLMGDSAFNDLIAHYAKRLHAQWDVEDDIYATMMTANRIRAEFTVTEHMDRAEDSGELIPLAMADKISQSRADRQGYGKHSTITHNHDFAAALDRAIERSGMKTIDAEVSPALVAPDAPVAESLSQAPQGTEERVLPPPPSPPLRADFAVVLKRRRLA